MVDITPVDIGTTANDGTGDPIRTAFDKVNQNEAALKAEVEIGEMTAKTTPVDADVTVIEDSAASGAKKKLSWSNIKATLKTYFDTIYSTFDGTWASLSGKPSTFTPSSHGDSAHSETYVKDSDSRLTNSREWTADTVTQAEAEAGTATTRRAWTAQRIAQAIAALASSLSLGTTSSTAHRGDHGAAAYNHSISAHAPSDAQKNSDITKAEIEAKLTGTITTHEHPTSPPTTTVVTKTSSYTLALADAGSVLQMNSSSSRTFSVPTAASVNFPIGTQIILSRIGTGSVTVYRTTGVSFIPNENKIIAENGVVGIIKVATNTWLIFGKFD
jgi:hypothetical protein